MCDFISWVEYKDHNYFLTDTDLRTKEGKSLVKYLGDKFTEDIKGHGAIRTYYKELLKYGKDKECTDLSSPDNLPKEIVDAVKKGLMTRIGYSLDLLNFEGKEKYEKVTGPAWAEYVKVRGPALAEYEKVKGPAWAEYEKVKGQALAEYEKVKGPALAEYEKVKGQAHKLICKAKDCPWNGKTIFS